MMLNKELNLSECMDILNEMMKEKIEHDSGNGEIIYILIDPSKIYCLKKLIPEEENLKKYLYDYGDDWEECGFDIVGIWGAISSKFDVDISVNFKEKKFYIKESETSGYTCWSCGTKGEAGELHHRVRIVTADGQTLYVPTCSQECGKKTKEKYYKFHQERANDVKDQCIQIMRWE